MPVSREEDLKKYAFSLYDLYDYVLTREWLNLLHISMHILIFFPGVEKKISKEIMHIYYTTYLTMPKHKNPLSRGSWNLQVWYPFPWLSILYNFSDLCLGVCLFVVFRPNRKFFHLDGNGPRRSRSRIERLPRKRKVGFSNPNRDRPKLLKQVVTAPLPNARH